MKQGPALGLAGTGTPQLHLAKVQTPGVEGEREPEKTGRGDGSTRDRATREVTSK